MTERKPGHMDFLSRTLKEEGEDATQAGEAGEAGKNIDFATSWRFNASEDDEKRKMKKVWHRQQVLMLASKVNRRTINEMLLKEQDVFQDTPKYMAITKRLYRPFEETYRQDRLDVSTADDSTSVKDLSSQFWGGPSIKRNSNRHRWKLQTSPPTATPGRNSRFLSLDAAQGRKPMMNTTMKPTPAGVVSESRGLFERADSAAGMSQKSAMQNKLADHFRSTFTSGFTATQNKAWLRENYRQLRLKIDDLTREANSRMDRVKERHSEVKLNESNRRSHANSIADRTLTRRSNDEIKAMFERNNRVMNKTSQDKRFSTLSNDRVFKSLLSDAHNFYQSAVRRPDQMTKKCLLIQSWALKETCFEYLVKILELLMRVYD